MSNRKDKYGNEPVRREQAETIDEKLLEKQNERAAERIEKNKDK